MINEIRRYLQKRVKKVSENVFNEKFSKYLRKITKCKEAGGDLQKRNKNVNVTFLIRVIEKFSKTYPSIPELETYKNKTCLNFEFTKSPVSSTSRRPLQKKIRETLPFLNKIKKTPSPHSYPSPDSFQVRHPKKNKKNKKLFFFSKSNKLTNYVRQKKKKTKN